MIVAWLGLLALAVVGIGIGLGDNLTTEAHVTGTPESRLGFDAIDRHLPHLAGSVDEIVIVHAARHAASDPEFRARVQRVLDAGSSLPIEPLTAPNAHLPTSADGHSVMVPLRITARDKASVARELVARATALSGGGIDVLVTGDNTIANDLGDLSNHDLKQGELLFGLPVALVVLLLVFGTVVGALLPLLLGGVAIIAALGLAAAIATQFELSVFLINMVSGMGLALGTDYSLFILSRYREERHGGRDRDAAITVSGATASRAVLFSGMTFVIALVGMLLVPTTIMRSLALGAILVGLTAVAAALTLLPALLRLLGDRVDALPLPVIGRRIAASTGSDSGLWRRIVGTVLRRPVLWGAAVVALLIVCAVPVADLHTGASGVGVLPDRMPSRQGYDVLHRDFPDASTSPAQIVVTASDVSALHVQRTITRIERALAADDRYGPVSRDLARDHQAVLLQTAVGTDPLGEHAINAVRHLRSSIVAGALRAVPASASASARDMHVYVTGETAANIDYFDVMRDWTLPVFAFVLGLSFLLLMVVFRSIVLPLKAIVLNLLSVGATYGLIVLVFQHGVGADLLGLRQIDAIDAWIPLFLFSVLFGLSMDYHMFLLTRIRERWAATGNTADAVSWGIASTGRVITGAAFIIIAVFLGFASGDLVMFQQLGFGIGVSLLIDATLVRGVLLPAAMVLLGSANWYLPRWLRWLPELQLERDS